jgi:hypothetical protein
MENLYREQALTGSSLIEDRIIQLSNCLGKKFMSAHCFKLSLEEIAVAWARFGL